MSRTTTTAANRMTAKEIDRFLAVKHVARLGTVRDDGDAHVTPVWYLWNDGKFEMILGVTRVHVKNLQRAPRATLCIDEDARLEHGFGAGAQGVVVRGSVEMTQDEDVMREVFERFAQVYDLVDDPAYYAARASEPRLIVFITPDSWQTWDFTKA